MGFSSCGAQAWLLCSICNLLDQGLNLCPLHWQVDSYPLYHQGSPLCLTSDVPSSREDFPEEVQKTGLCAPNEEGPGWIPGQELVLTCHNSKFCMLQLRLVQTNKETNRCSFLQRALCDSSLWVRCVF